MSLVGIRDMSVLEEPPVDRLPIQTFVTEHNDEMIRERRLIENLQETDKCIMCITVFKIWMKLRRMSVR